MAERRSGWQLGDEAGQKSVAWIKDMVKKLSKPGAEVAYPCAGMFSTPNTCVMLR